MNPTAAAGLTTARRPRWLDALRSPLVGIVATLAAATLLWYLLSFTHRLVPTPLQSVQEVVRQWRLGILGEHFRWTLGVTLRGFAGACVVGVGLGVLLGVLPRARAVFGDMVYSVASIPKLVLFPIVLVFLGLGRGSESFFVGLSAVFLILIHTMVGCGDIQEAHRKVGRIFRASTWQMVVKVYLPSIAPSLVAGLRLGFSMGLVHAILAEMSLGNHGLGTRIWVAYRDLNMGALYGIVLLVSLIAVAGNASLWYVEKRLRGGTTQAWAKV